MTAKSVTGVELFFDKKVIIASKTDLKGRITCANDVFPEMVGYREDEDFGQLHSSLRHPDMPRSGFKLLWDTIAAGQEYDEFIARLQRAA